MLPEVQTYVDSVNAAQEEYDNAGYDNRDYEKMIDAYRAAWKKLGEDTNDALIKWIVESNEIRLNFYGHAQKIMELLPADLVTIDKYAAERGWCGVWNNLRNQAIAAGAIEHNIRLEMRHSGNSQWGPFRPYRLADLKNFSKKDAMALLLNGVEVISLELRNGRTFHIRRDPETILPCGE